MHMRTMQTGSIPGTTRTHAASPPRTAEGSPGRAEDNGIGYCDAARAKKTFTELEERYTALQVGWGLLKPHDKEYYNHGTGCLAASNPCAAHRV